MEPFDRHQPEYDDPKEEGIVTQPLPQVPFDMKPVPPDTYYIRRSRRRILRLYFFIILLVLCVNGTWVLYWSHTSSWIGHDRAVFNDLVMPDIKVVATPDPGSIKQVNIRQSMKITVQLTTRDKHTILSQSQGSFGQGNGSVQQLLGDHNVACIDAQVYTDPDQLNFEPAQTQEYPLNQTIVTLSWIVTPKQTGEDFFDINFFASGKSACAMDKDPIVGPYLLGRADVSYNYNVIGPNSTPAPTATPIPITKVVINAQNTSDATSPQNVFVQAYNNLGLGTIISGALTTLVAALVAWLCTQWWKQRKKKTDAKMPPKATSKPSQSGKRSSRRNRKKPVAVK